MIFKNRSTDVLREMIFDPPQKNAFISAVNTPAEHMDGAKLQSKWDLVEIKGGIK